MTSRTPDRHPRRHAPPILHCAIRQLPLLAVLTVACPAAAILAPQPRHLEYRVAWNGIPAAGATVEITPVELAGHHSLVVEASAHTNAFVDLFWSFRGTARTTLLADGLTPLQFIYDRRMAGTPYVTTVDFDDHGARSVYVRGARRRDFELDQANVIDPITAVFRARLSGAHPGSILHYDVWTGEKRYRIELDVQPAEPIDVPAGHFSALPVVPVVWELGDQPERDTRLRQATIWVADDATRTLLRIRSQLFFGAVTLDLVTIQSTA